VNILHFSYPRLFHLLWIIPVAGLFFYLSWKQGERALKRFSQLDRGLSSVEPRKRLYKRLLMLAAFFFIVLGLTRPGWNPGPVTVSQQGRDVAFVVDVSRSMLAEDLVPNRLERSKLAIMDALEVIEGDRVALVAFAGYATVTCPLTQDYHFFRWAVENLSPENVSLGGTMIGDAVRKVSEDVFDPLEQNFKDIILITDGEDHESYPVEAAGAAGEQGIRLITIGLGDELQGRPIPITDEGGNRTFLTYEGEEVRTRLNPDILREMAESTPGGRYLHVSTGAFDLGSIYRSLILSEEKREIQVVEAVRYEEKFQFFLAAALVLLAAEMVLGERRRRRGEGS
jgi:Ca-activated chloride channel family protein